MSHSLMTFTLTSANLLHLQEVVESADLKASQQIKQRNAAHPQLNGCVDSPEAATVVLLCVGMAGILLGTRMFRRLAAPQGASRR